MNIRVVANLSAAVVLVVGLVGYIASDSSVFGFLFLAGCLFLFTNTFLKWMMFGNRTSWPQADDLRRADDDSRGDESSILPPHWPGQP